MNCDHCGATGRIMAVLGCTTCRKTFGKKFVIFRKKRKKNGKFDYPFFCGPCRKSLYRKHDQDAHYSVDLA